VRKLRAEGIRLDHDDTAVEHAGGCGSEEERRFSASVAHGKERKWPGGFGEAAGTPSKRRAVGHDARSHAARGGTRSGDGLPLSAISEV
jgi:hypothetical protein